MEIMLVEDDELFALATETLLRFHGHRVIGPFPRAADAFRAVQGGRPDLALMDISLASRCSGLDCARVLFGRYGIPVVFLCGDPDLARRGADSALGVLAKPTEADALLRVIRSANDLAQGRVPQSFPPGFIAFRRSEPRPSSSVG